jgi:short-subunit dehydrogenase
MMKDLRGKVIVLTGAGSGMGRAMAIKLDREGSMLALMDKDEKILAETSAMLSSAGHRAYTLDISDFGAVDSVALKVVNDFGFVDVLINNAGVSSSGLVRELTRETLEWTMDINFWGTVNMTRAYLPHLLKRSEANIVNMSSVYGLIGIPGQAAYCASKFAVRGFTEALRQEYYGSSLSVTVVFPGGVRTNIAKNSRTDHRLDRETYLKEVVKFEATLKTTAEEAADTIINGLKKNSKRVLIGKDARGIDFLARFNPDNYDAAIAKYVKKSGS